MVFSLIPAKGRQVGKKNARIPNPAIKELVTLTFRSKKTTLTGVCYNKREASCYGIKRNPA
jgi:hypothetical protein